jgi:hypothetical protein
MSDICFDWTSEPMNKLKQRKLSTRLYVYGKRSGTTGFRISATAANNSAQLDSLARSASYHATQAPAQMMVDSTG